MICMKCGRDTDYFSIDDVDPGFEDVSNSCVMCGIPHDAVPLAENAIAAIRKEYIQNEYLSKEGLACPYCGSESIDAIGMFDSDNKNSCLYQDVVCMSCGKEWQDKYTLTGFIEIEEEN